METEYYYECHITIEPVFDERLEKVKELADMHHFKVADLLMKKREEDTEIHSSKDTFMTGHSKNYSVLEKRMVSVILSLQENEYRVWRYKIEDIVLDSRIDDKLNLIIR